MKTLTNFIIESIKDINEGGNAVRSDRIPAVMAMPLFNEIKKKINSRFSDVDMRVLGSVGKKKHNDTNGDIDIAINITDIHKLEKMVEIVFPDVDKATMPGFGIVSIGYPYEYKGRKMLAQVDFMMQDDLEWAEFFYASPDFTKDESQFNGALRNTLLSIIIAEVPTDDAPTMQGDSIATRYKYNLSYKGFSKQFLDYRGKNNNLLKNPKKNKELETFISKNWRDVIGFIFKKPDLKIMNSVETLWKAIHTDNFKYKELLPSIESKFEKHVLELNGIDVIKILEKK